MTHSLRGLGRVLSLGLAVLLGVLIANVDFHPPTAHQAEAAPPAAPAPALVAPADGANPADIAARVLPAVVNISSERVVSTRNTGPFFSDPFFQQFFGRSHRGVPQNRREASRGSGVLVDATGVVLTNNHVIDDADDVRVTLHDGREFGAEVVGKDPRSDLAVLRLTGDDDEVVEGLPVLEFGDSDSLRPGDSVMAVGNPFGLSGTVTMGIVSAKGRANVGIVDYEDFIQTDAAINPGNSGGALVNLDGELVGINSAILSRSGGYQGIGFAIPSNMAGRILHQLLDDGRVARGWLGVTIQDVDDALAGALGADVEKGALVSEVLPGSPAQKAGLKAGDIVTELDGDGVKSSAELRNRIGLLAPDSTVKLSVVRNGKNRTMRVKLGERDDPSVAEKRLEDDDGALAGLRIGPLDREARERFDIPPKVDTGVVVLEVDPDSPAARAGIRPGDVIAEVNRAPIDDPAEFAERYRPDADRTLLRIRRPDGSRYLLLG